MLVQSNVRKYFDNEALEYIEDCTSCCASTEPKGPSVDLNNVDEKHDSDWDEVALKPSAWRKMLKAERREYKELAPHELILHTKRQRPWMI